MPTTRRTATPRTAPTEVCTYLSREPTSAYLSQVKSRNVCLFCCAGEGGADGGDYSYSESSDDDDDDDDDEEEGQSDEQGEGEDKPTPADAPGKSQ